MLPSYASGKVTPRHHPNVPNGYPRKKDNFNYDMEPHRYAILSHSGGFFQAALMRALANHSCLFPIDTNHEAQYQLSDDASGSSSDSA